MASCGVSIRRVGDLLDGKRVVVEAMGVHAFPALDRFYVPSPDVPSPKTWDDYEYELIPGAEEQLIEWIHQQS